MSKNHETLNFCRQAEVLLDKRLDDISLTVSEETFLKEHLSRCPACQASAREMETALAALKSLELLPVPEDLTDRIMARVRTEPLKPKLHVPLPFSIAAAILAVVIAIPLLQHAPKSSPIAHLSTSTATHPISIIAPKPHHPPKSAQDQQSPSEPPSAIASKPPAIGQRQQKAPQTNQPAANKNRNPADSPSGIQRELIAQASTDDFTPFPTLISDDGQDHTPQPQHPIADTDPIGQMFPSDDDEPPQDSDTISFDTMGGLVGF